MTELHIIYNIIHKDEKADIFLALNLIALILGISFTLFKFLTLKFNLHDSINTNNRNLTLI